MALLTSNSNQERLPRRVIVSELISSRYGPGARPASWDERRTGIELVKTDGEETINLFSNGGQSSPAPGWELLLTGKADREVEKEVSLEEIPSGETTEVSVYTWTLFGVS